VHDALVTRVHLGSDHAGFEFKARLVAWLREQGHDPVDHGPHSYEPEDDYPPYCLAAAAATVADPGSLGVVLGGSGNGEAIAANKVPGARCALAFSEETARLGREHNNANVISLGARMYSEEDAVKFLAAFLETPFSEGERHIRRIGILSAYEASGVLPPLPT
jgi:ribose 5-phosphate isomerase B